MAGVNARGMIVLGGLAALLSVLGTQAGKSATGEISPEQMHALAVETKQRYGFNISPGMATAIAIVESGDVNMPENGLNVYAARYEPGLQDTSTGLMQTLTSTAQWLAQDMGESAFGMPSASDLLKPQESVYFGMAYLNWLSSYAGQSRSESWIVQSYNAGPGRPSSAYLQKYNRAKAWLQQKGLF